MPIPQYPPRPCLENRKKQAKTLLKALRSGELAAARRFQANLPRLHHRSPEKILQDRVTLQEAQHVLAREYGFRNWSALRQALVSGSALGLLEGLSDDEVHSVVSQADATQLATALKAVSGRCRTRFRGAMSASAWASVEERMVQLGPMRLSDVEQMQLSIVQRLPGENLFV